MAASTRSRVVFEIGRLPVMTYETVLCDTPATRATSLLVNATTPAPLLSIRIVDAHRHASAPLRRPQDPVVVAAGAGPGGCAIAADHAGCHILGPGGAVETCTWF